MKTPFRPRLASAALLLLLCSGLSLFADYQSSVSLLNPIIYYRFNEAASTPALNSVANSSSLGSALNGIAVTADDNPPVLGEAGIIGTCARFLNTGNTVGYCGPKIRVPNNLALNKAGAFSVECWLKMNSLGADATGFAIWSSMQQDFAASSRVGYLMYVNNNGQYEFRLGNAAGYVGTVNNTANPPFVGAPGYPATPGVWRHVVCAFDGATSRIFVNGTNVATRTLSAADIASLRQNTQTPFQMCGTPFSGTLSDGPDITAVGTSGNRGFDGWLDEVAYYPYAVTTNQAFAHYQAASTNAGGYSAQILADNPAGYWGLNEPAHPTPPDPVAANAANIGSAGSAANATNTWGVLNGQPGPSYAGFGAGNKACLYDGDNGFLSLPIPSAPAALSNLNGNVTMMAWVKPTQRNFFRYIIAHGWEGPNTGDDYAETFLRISRGSGNSFYGTTNFYEVGTTDGNTIYTARSAIPEGDLGSWVFVAGTYDGTTLHLYRNGTEVATTAAPYGAVAITNRWSIGSRSDANENLAEGCFFGGLIDEPAVFSTALSGTDINNLYLAAQPPPSVNRPISTPDGYVNHPWPTLFKGGAATLTVGADGVPPLSYYWYSNNVLVASSGTSYTIPFLAVGTPTFSVVVSNQYGLTTNSTTLTIIAAPPSITAQPIPLLRYPGSNFTFWVNTGGSVPQSFQWKTNNTDITGATATNYSDTASAAKAFNYSCFVSNEAGTITTANAALTVLPAPFLYGAAVTADGPMALWRLGEASGNIAYDIVGYNNGTYFNPTLGQPGYSTLDSNTAVQFGAVNNYVGGISGTAIDFAGTTNSFSLECWVNGAAGQNDESGIICKGTGATGTTANEQFALDIAFGNFRFMTRGNGGTIYSANANNIGPNGTWQHVVGVYDASTPASPQMYIYVNGALAGTGPGNPAGVRASSSLVSIGSKRLGNSPDYDGYFTGLIDEMAIYNKALSASTIETHYGAAYGSSLVPFFTVQPANTTNYAGLTATLSVGAAGTVPLAYQWYKIGVGAIGGATDFFYTVNPLTPGDEGTYYVNVSNPVLTAGTNSAQVYLRVLATPSSSPAIPGLVMLHKFENNLVDSTGRGNNGTAVAKTQTTTNNSATPTYVDGHLGAGSKAYHYQSDFGPSASPNNFTTTNTEYVTLGVRPDLQFSSNINFTVAMWIKLPLNFIGGDLPFFTDTPASLGGQGYVFSPAYGYGNVSGANPTTAPLNYGGWGMSLYDAGSANGARIYGDLGSINDGGWHHLVYVLDRNKQCVTYLDGNPAKSFKITGTTTAAAKTIDAVTNVPAATIGQDPGGIYRETGSGDIDDLAVWTRALSPLEAASVYVAGVAGFSPAYVSPPVIGTQPASIVAPVGTATNLTVVVTSTSTGVTNYQWQRNSQDLPGATSATLNFASLVFTNYGDYRVRVDDGGLIVYSSTVTVRPPADGLVINTSPASKIVPFGLATTLTVVASTTSGATNYQWRFYGTNASAANYTGITTKTLSISSMSSAKVGPYDVVVNDGYNFKTSTVANLTLAQQPTISNFLSGGTLSLTFATEVGPQYVWEWKGALTNGAWNQLSTNNGTGSPVTINNSTGLGPQRFFRVRMQ